MSLLLTIVALVAFYIALGLVYELYIIVRKRLNRPKIGTTPRVSILRRDDYVSINGQLLRFSHIASGNESLNVMAPPSYRNQTNGGELAFCDDRTLGYVYYHQSAMAKCDFIFGKYGLKWARNNDLATAAKERIKNF